MGNSFFKLFLFTLAFLSSNLIHSQWTWVKGDSVVNATRVYGTKGISSPTNKPSARYNSVSWTDIGGNLWLFGGREYDVNGGFRFLNDLWKYNPTINEWTWVKGDNTPNSVGIYGTQGVPSLNNNPGGRFESVSWPDQSGNLWLFGGYGYNGSGFGYFNDLWKYDAATNQWTCLKGNNTTNNTGVFGTRGVSSSANNPAGRGGAVSWKDKSGSLWLFGGSGYTNGYGRFNDLWKYNAANNEWTWMKGDQVVNVPSVYGAQGTSSPNNKPAGRQYSVSWSDTSGNMWLFGGRVDEVSNLLNDLWKYNPTSNEWTWVKGDNTFNASGIYGTKGTSSPTSKPPAKIQSVSWTDGLNNLWLFGGEGNDLWKYQVASDEWTWMSGDSLQNVKGVYGMQGQISVNNKPGQEVQALAGLITLEDFGYLEGQDMLQVATDI